MMVQYERIYNWGFVSMQVPSYKENETQKDA